MWGRFFHSKFSSDASFSRYLQKTLNSIRRREKDGKRGLRGVLGRLDSDVPSLEQCDWERRREMTGVSRLLGRLDFTEHLPAP